MDKNLFGFHYAPIPKTNKNDIIHDCPHYTEDLYKHPQIVFGEEVPGMHVEYSDRITEWDYKKSHAAMEVANKKVKTHTAEWYEAWLSEFFGYPVDVKCIWAGFNVYNGYPYQAIGFVKK